MNKEHRAHTICQCCGQAIVKPNLGIVRFPKKNENSAIRLITLAEVYGMNLSRELTKGNPEILPIENDAKSLKKIEVLRFMYEALIFLENQAATA